MNHKLLTLRCDPNILRGIGKVFLELYIVYRGLATVEHLPYDGYDASLVLWVLKEVLGTRIIKVLRQKIAEVLVPNERRQLVLPSRAKSWRLLNQTELLGYSLAVHTSLRHALANSFRVEIKLNFRQSHRRFTRE